MTPTLFRVLVVNFVDTLGFSIVMPFLVFLVMRFGGNAFVFGVVSAVYPLCQLVAAPILGSWSDRYGRKRIMLLCELGTLLAWAIFVLALVLPAKAMLHLESGTFGSFTVTLPLLLVLLARACDGITGGNVSVANAYVADISPPKQRSRNFAHMNISSNLGYVVGPALGGLLGATGMGELLPALVTLVVSGLATFLVAFQLPESKPCVMSTAAGAGGLRKVLGQEPRDCVPVESAGIRPTLRIKYIRLMLGLYFLVFLGFNFYYTAFPVHAAQALGWNAVGTGIYFAALSLVMVGVQGPLLALASRRFSDASLIVIGGVILGANFLLLISGNLVAVAGSVLLFAIGNGLMWPSVVAMLSKLAGDHAQGTAQGLASSCGSLASILGLVAGGVAYEHLGARTFVFASALIYGACLAALPLLRARPHGSGAKAHA